MKGNLNNVKDTKVILKRIFNFREQPKFQSKEKLRDVTSINQLQDVAIKNELQDVAIKNEFRDVVLNKEFQNVTTNSEDKKVLPSRLELLMQNQKEMPPPCQCSPDPRCKLNVES